MSCAAAPATIIAVNRFLASCARPRRRICGAGPACPNACLPKGLKDIPGLGCRELKIDGKRGALVCFKQENDVVHLVAFKRCDVKCRLPKKGEPDIGRHGKWSVARWADDEWVFVLMGEKNVDVKRLADLF